MSIDLRIYQEKTNGLGEDRSVLAARGEIEVEDAIIWLVNDYSPGHLVNHVSGDVKRIGHNFLVISHSYYTGQFIPGVIETGDVEDWCHYSWRYEFVGSVETLKFPGDTSFDHSPDFQQIKHLIWTFAKAWGQEYPDALGSVIDQLIALERQPA